MSKSEPAMSATAEGAMALSRWYEENSSSEVTVLRGVTESKYSFVIYDPNTSGLYTVTVLPALVASALVGGVDG